MKLVIIGHPKEPEIRKHIERANLAGIPLSIESIESAVNNTVETFKKLSVALEFDCLKRQLEDFKKITRSFPDNPYIPGWGHASVLWPYDPKVTHTKKAQPGHRIASYHRKCFMHAKTFMNVNEVEK